MRFEQLGTYIKSFIKSFVRVPDFFRNKPRATTAPRFRKPAPQNNKRAIPLRLWLGVGAAGIAAFALVIVLARYASLDFTLITVAVLALCGMVAFDVLSRRTWERALSTRIEQIAQNHDRLVREVARNRNELALFKETLARAGQAATAEARRLPPTGSAESRMMHAIATRLGGLADLPRPAADDGSAGEGILELTVAPPPRALPAPLDSPYVTDPDRLSDERIRSLLRAAVKDDHIDIFMQPVVSLPQRKIRMMEIFARIRAGEAGHISGARYVDIARAENMLGAIDNLLLLRCLQMLRDTRDDDQALPCALNIAAATLQDAGFMNDLVAFLAQHRHLAARLIFELPQTELNALNDELAPILSGLAQLGCRFSVDGVENRRINVHRLRARHVRFLKLDAAWLIREGQSPGGITRIAALKKQLDSAGIDLIVEKIETEESLRELLDFSVDFGQGYLFAAPEHATTLPSPHRRVA